MKWVRKQEEVNLGAANSSKVAFNGRGDLIAEVPPDDCFFLSLPSPIHRAILLSHVIEAKDRGLDSLSVHLCLLGVGARPSLLGRGRGAKAFSP